MLQLILNELFPLDEEYVAKQIDDATMAQVCFGRLGGIRYKVLEDEVTIIAWQCNIADVQNCDVKLPTVITLHLNRDNYVTKASLFKNFKGSQGLPCSWKYLNRRLKSIILNKEFTLNNPILRDQTIFSCRHIFELVYGACAFYSYYRDLGLNESFVSECTSIFSIDGALECYDKISINGKEAKTRVDFTNYVNRIHYMSNGKVEKVDDIKICGYEPKDDEWLPINNMKSISAENDTEYVMKMMKLISPYWRSSCKRVGTTSKFYFSHLWPPTLFGILSQSFGISLFNKNYAYFQHCIYGLQRNEEGKPFCIGVIDSLDEGELHFKGFLPEDVYI